MKKVLVFTYYWPPASSPGVQRWLKFSKYLRHFGWEPMVVTPRHGSYPNMDASLLNDVPEGMQVYRTGTLEPFRLYNILTGQEEKGKASPVGMMEIKDAKTPIQKLARFIRANLFIPDARIGWVPYAYRVGKKLIAEGLVDAIVTTGPPHSSHLIGMKLHGKYGIPWIAGLRDPWTNIYYNDYLPRTKRTKRKDKALEDKVISGADAVIVVTPGSKEEFMDRAQKIHVIYNGYDESDFSIKDPIPTNYFTLVYTGNLIADHNVAVLWQAISELRNEIPQFELYFRLKLIGNIDGHVLKSIKQARIDHLLTVEDFIPHTEAVARMQRACMLLLVVPICDYSDSFIPGKLFEYLASCTELLAFGPHGSDVDTILKQCNRPPIIDYADLNATKQRISEAYGQWRANGKVPAKHGGDEHDQFSRRALTGKLAEVLNDITEATQET
jgi:glycosyltransferase involved in cell wall biosynthesis